MTPTTFTVNLPRPHAKQSEILSSRARFRVAAIGRQFGKTTLATIACTNRVLRGQRIWYCTPTYRLAKQIYASMKAAFRNVRVIKTNDSDLLISLPNGGFIQFVGLQEIDNLRGQNLNFIVMDEAAHIHANAWQLLLRPMLITTQGEALFISSPNGVNWFRDLFLLGLDDTNAEYAAWQLPSSASPYVPQSEIDNIRRDTPERAFRQEYLAEFLEDGGAVFRNFRNCIVPSQPASGDLVAGVDLGRVNDFTVIVIMDVDTRNVVHIDRFTDTAWTVQMNRMKALAEQFPIRRWLIENNIERTVSEQLAEAGLPISTFTTTNANKSHLINQLAVGFEQQSIGIPDNPILLGELQSYTVERTPNGSIRYTAPNGLHDDMVMALALVYEQALHRTIISPSALIRI